MADETETVDQTMVHYAVYNATGKIVAHGQSARCTLPFYIVGRSEPCQVMEIAPDDYDPTLDVSHYIVDGALAVRADVDAQPTYSIAADGVASVTFDVPPGTKCVHEGEILDIEDGTFDLTSDIADTFEFFFQPPGPFKDFRVTIHAN